MNSRKLIRRGGIIAATVAAIVIAGGTGASFADTPNHYFIEVGGTGTSMAAPACTDTYQFADKHLDGGIPVPVCYEASGGPFVDSHNQMPAPGAPSFDASVAEGYQNTMRVAEDVYHKDPGARFTIVGYSQGAWVGDLILQKIAANGTDIPRSQVDGMLYTDPMQPDTGLFAQVPKGLSIAGITSPGPGPETFDGVPVQRFCIHTDGVCDATSIQSINGLLTQHPRYHQDGDSIMNQTIATDGAEGTHWYPAI